MRFFTFILLLALSFNVLGQSQVEGVLTDEQGQAIVGANVVLQESRQGAATDLDGRYSIQNVKPWAYTLVVSYVGYQEVRQQVVVEGNDSTVEQNLRLAQRIFNLDGLTITATRAGEKTPMTYTNLDKEELEERNLGQDVPYLLRWTPSAVVTSDAGTGIGYTGIRIRGSDPTRINVTINGIPLNDAESQGVFWVDLPDFISSTNDVQIQRGVGTSTNGAGAFGASINLNTAKLKEKAYGSVNLSTGSFNTFKRNVTFGSGLLNGKFTLDGRLSRITSDGYIDRGSADLDSYFLSGAYVGKKSSLRFNLFSGHEITYQAWNGVPASLIDDPESRTFNSAGTDREGEPYENEVDNYRQTHYQLLYDQQLENNWQLSLALHYTDGMGFFENYEGGADMASFNLSPITIGGETISESDLIQRRWLDNDFYGGIFSLQHQTEDQKLTSTLGGGYNIYEGAHFGEVIWSRYASESEWGDRYYENDAEKKDFNIYAKWNYELTEGLNAYVDLQYRAVSYEFLGFNDNLQNVDQSASLNFFNPKAGLWYQVNDESEMYVSFAVANREPNRNDYTENPISAVPRPERLYNTELGYKWQNKKGAFGANLYYMSYQDQLVLNGQLNDVGEYIRINVDQSYRAGIELVGGVALSPSVRFDLNATFSDNKVQEFTEYMDMYDEEFNWLGQKAVVRENTPLAFSPSVITSGDLSWQALDLADQQLTFNLMAKYVSRQYIDNSGDDSNVLDPYFFTDLGIHYRWQPKGLQEIGLRLLVRNITDNLYETNAWSYRYQFGNTTLVDQGFYPQAGINYLLGLTVSF
ncbi:MAG: TonB-dependent receptor [Saprospiraceae bacterium]|nr:TonB-dependent receptor [Saprospiraceae bacterium]